MALRGKKILLWLAVVFCHVPVLETVSTQNNVLNHILRRERVESHLKDQKITTRSIEKRSVSDANMLTIFREVYESTRSGLTDIVRLTEKYYSLIGDAKAMCSGDNNLIACDLVLVLRQLMILRGMHQQLYYNKVRSFLQLKDIDETKYLEQLKLSRDFRMLLTDVQFGQNTIITVTQKLSSGLQTYLSATASFDKDIGTADVGYISNRLKELKSGSNKLWDETISGSMGVILRGAVAALSAQVAADAAALAFEILQCVNPFAVLSGNCDGAEILDRMEALMTSTRNLANAGTLLAGLGKLKDEMTTLINKFKQNEDQLTDMRTILNTFVNSTDERKKTMAEEFIEKYGGYTPAVTDQDLARVAAALDYVASAGCDLIEGAGGVAGTVAGMIIDNAMGDCARIGADLAELEAFYADIFSFQFELIDAFTAIVRADIAKAYSNSIPSSTQLNVRPMVIGLLMDEVKIQRTAREVCDVLEYVGASSRPQLCKTMFFSDGALQALIAYSRSISTSKKVHYAYIPSEPSTTLNDKTFIDIDRLIAGDTVYFTPPYNDLDWMKTYKWLPKSYNLETGFYIESIGIFPPGIRCRDGPDMPVAISIKISNQKTVKVHPSSLSPSYLIPTKTLSFKYRYNSGYCQACSELPFPERTNSNPGEIKKQHNLCIKSEGVVSKCESASLPSLYSTWKIRLVSEGCEIIRDTSLDYKPMVTVALTVVEVKAATDECWPNPCQYRGVCADKVMDFECQCRSPMSGKICNEVKSGYEGSSPDACDMTTNIALGRPSQQSSVYEDWGRVVFLRAHYANDANTASNYFIECCHTNREEKPYWYVELPITHKVCAVNITNRGDSEGSASRLGDAKVVISDRNPGLPNRVETLCGTVKSNPGNGEVITVECAEPIPASKGRFLTIYLPKTEYLHICDVQVFTTRATSPKYSITPPLWKKCDWTTNIAKDGSRRAKVELSSKYNDRTKADNLVDGDYMTSHFEKCAETKREDDPWAAIKFKSTYEICGVKILYRGDDTATRNIFAKIGVMDDIPSLGMGAERDNFRQCGSLPGTLRKGDMTSVSCEMFPVTGNTVVVYIPRNGILNMCEIEVYRTKD